MEKMLVALIAAISIGSPAAAQSASDQGVPDSLIEYWAKHAIPLAEYVELGYGMSEPADATSSEWCPQQPNTISLSYADSDMCKRLLEAMRKIGRIK